MNKIYKDGMMGLIVGDALGVPVEFSLREDRKEDPVKEMRSYGTYNQPEGTWSDDSSMALATLHSIKQKEGIDYKDIMDNFILWRKHGNYSPFGKVFDVGITTDQALTNYLTESFAPEKCGKDGEGDNGNGSLMRILPACIYLYEREADNTLNIDEIINTIHDISAFTHGHLRSMIGCGIYYFLVKEILSSDLSLNERLIDGMKNALDYYGKDPIYANNLNKYDRLIDLNLFKETNEDGIISGGYVVTSLEAAIWCLLNTDSYKDCVLKAVNLGNDTDTIGAIAGGLAGLYYEFESIPKDWVGCIKNMELIESIIH